MHKKIRLNVVEIIYRRKNRTTIHQLPNERMSKNIVNKIYLNIVSTYYIEEEEYD